MQEGNVQEQRGRSFQVCPAKLDELCSQVKYELLAQEKYKEPDYSIDKLAYDLGTCTRYVSAVFAERFNCSFRSFLNHCRVEAATSLMEDEKYQDSKVGDIYQLVGFANRQSFYNWFTKFMGVTPRQYHLKCWE